MSGLELELEEENELLEVKNSFLWHGNAFGTGGLRSS
jgi:hypothetical protein